ncbi:cytochrome P450 [Actinokineospora sp. G85]|uniref:cytochrome P450 n=1 Tax=Actinokineospora sp. G85 TaxID=3406626 RepID=UPI003C7703E6
MLTQGYAWLPDLLRAAGSPVVRTRVMGKRAVCVHGVEAAKAFYDEANVRRGGALPEPVKSTLFGHGAVHTLDTGAHRRRKGLFTDLLMDRAGIGSLRDLVEVAWDKRVSAWRPGEPVSLFDETAAVLTSAVSTWVGLADENASAASDLVAMVDGFATPAPRHFAARRARARQERRLAAVVEQVRAGSAVVPADSAVHAIATHTDEDGKLLSPRVAAVEILNVIRPTVAITWFATFSAHAMHLWPHTRDRVAHDDRYTLAFADEVRRFYPFAPFLGGVAVRDFDVAGERVPRGAMVILDVYGHNHDPALFREPYTFDPARFEGREIGQYELIPQGGGHPATGHRCPGEDIVVALLSVLAPRIARLEVEVPDQDLEIPFDRIPTRPRSGFTVIPRR